MLAWLGHGALWAGDFQDAYAAALLNDPQFQAAKAELASALQSVPMARAGLLPSVSLSVSDAKINGSRTTESPLGPAKSPLDYRAPVQSLSVRVPIFNREATQKLQLAHAQVSYAQAVFATRQLDLLDRLTSAYLQRILAQQAVTTAKAQVAAAQAQSDLTRRRLQLGEGTQPERVGAEAELGMAEVMLVDAESQLMLASLSLNQMSGRDPGDQSMPADVWGLPQLMKATTAPMAPLDEFLRLADAANPSVDARRHGVTMAQTAVERNTAGHFPRLEFVAGATHSRNESLSTLNQSARQQSLGLNLNVPIYSGGYVSASVTQAVADLNKAQAELTAEQQSVAGEVTKLYFSATNGNAKLQAQKRAVEAAKLTLEGVRKGSVAGFNTQADTALAARKVAQTQQDQAKAALETLLYRARLQGRVGEHPDAIALRIDESLAPQ